MKASNIILKIHILCCVISFNGLICVNSITCNGTVYIGVNDCREQSPAHKPHNKSTTVIPEPTTAHNGTTTPSISRPPLGPHGNNTTSMSDEQESKSNKTVIIVITLSVTICIICIIFAIIMAYKRRMSLCKVFERARQYIQNVPVIYKCRSSDDLNDSTRPSIEENGQVENLLH